MVSFEVHQLRFYQNNLGLEEKRKEEKREEKKQKFSMNDRFWL